MNPKLLNDIIEKLNISVKNEFNKVESLNEILELLELEVVIPPGTPTNKKINCYYKTIIDYVEAQITEEERSFLYSNISFSIVQFIKDENVKKERLNASYNEWYANNDNDIEAIHIETIATLHDDEYKINFYKENKERIFESDAATLIASLDSDELIISYLPAFEENDEDLSVIISGISSDTLKQQYLNKYNEISGNYKINIIASFNSDEVKMSYLDKSESIPFKVIASLKSTQNIMKYWSRIKSNDKAKLLDYINDEQLKIQIIQELINSDYKSSLDKHIASLSSDNEKVNMLQLYTSNGKKFNPYTIIKAIENPSLKLEALKQYGDARTLKLVRKNKDLDAETILRNLIIFLKEELTSEELNHIEEYTNILNHMFVTNNDVLYTIDFKILSPKYLSTLGEDKINFISSFPDIQKQILELSDKEYEVFYHVINDYSEKNSKLDWTYIANQLLGAIHWKECEDLINDITSIDDVNIEYLTRVLLDGNPLKIKTIEELNNLPALTEKRCNEQIKSDNINEKINAIMVKLCGIGQDTNLLRGFAELRRHDTWHLVQLFGRDIDLIEDNSYKSFIKRLQEIQAVKDPEELERIYNSITEFRHIDVYKVETALKKAYMKLYNSCLLQIEGLPKNSDGLYEAGTSFNIITNSVGAYVKNSPENYKTDWNRPSLASQHFCTNFIRNDMIGLAPIPHISYGFTHMDDNSLMLSGPNDIYSTGASFISKAYNNEVYYAPDTQINETYKSKFKYNEMDFRRIENGHKKQPDYIIVYRRNGVIPNLDEARKASEQWDGLPIVVIDIDLCLQSEYEKLTTMLNEYYETKSIVLLKQIIQKILNNRVTEPSFAKEINLEEIKAELKEQEKTSAPPKM